MSIELYRKEREEVKLVMFDFKDYMAEDEALSEIVSHSSYPEDILFGTTTIHEKTVEILVSGGSEQYYILKTKAITEDGDKLEKHVLLNIQDT